MHDVLRLSLEDYLSGNLPARDRQEVESHLTGCQPCRKEWEDLSRSAVLLRQLRPPRHPEGGQEWEPAAGFYARVLEGIAAEREVPFWAMLLEPGFGRRLVFACLMLMAVLGAYVLALEPADYPSQHRPETLFAGRSAPVPGPRPGANIERNRSAMLATLVSTKD